MSRYSVNDYNLSPDPFPTREGDKKTRRGEAPSLKSLPPRMERVKGDVVE